jgi:hypothetical protein
MADPDNNSLLGDILAAASGPSASANPPPLAAPRARTELEDLLRLNDEHWGVFLATVAPDDLVVICKGVAPAWRTRVLANLDAASADWLRANVAALDEVAPALLGEARGRAMASAKRLLRDGDIVLPEPPPVKPAASPGSSMASAAKAAPVGAPAATPAAAAPAVPTAPAPTGDGLDVLFADLMRLRNQSGVASLATLANDVPDPFLKSGLCLVAAGLPVPDLERALDGALARQAEAYLDQLTRMRARLLALARG